MKKQKISPWLILFRILFTAGLAWTLVFIFGNSMKIAEASAGQSGRLLPLVNEWLAKLSLGPIGEYTLRKLAHFGEFLLLGFFSMLCLRVYTRHFVRHISWPLFFGLVVANVDETIQLYYPGRSSQMSDVWIDFAGVAAGALAALMILLFFRLCGLILFHEEESDYD